MPAAEGRMSKLKTEIKNLTAAWDRFWFAPVDLYNLALFRCVFFCVLFVMYVLRFFEIKLLFYNEGLMPFALAKEFAPPFYAPLFYWFPTSNVGILTAYLVFLVLLLLGALGFLRRWSTWLVLALHLAFLQRNYTVIYGADLISSFWLFYLSLADHSRGFRVWKSEACPVVHQQNDLLTSVAYRLIQIQLCITYGYTGLEKLKGTSWWEGTAVWKVLGNTQLAPMDFSFMVRFPVLIALMTYSTLLFEIYFPVAVWYKPLRKYWLSLGAAFHLVAAWSMGLHFFSLLMIVAYIPFISSQTWREFLARAKFSRA
jgi:hypothetical protein